MISTKAKFQQFVVIGIVLLFAAVAVVYFYARDQFRDAIQASGEAGNAALTRVFVNESWGEISRLLPPPGADANAVKTNPNIHQIDEKVRRFAMYTDVVKVKLYNIKGLTVYSSEAAQIGEDKSTNPGFQAAARGSLASELTTRGKFSAFDAEIYNRDLISTYAPIREGYQVVAVAEIYSDRTASLKVTESLLNKFLLLTIAVFLALFVGVLIIFSRVAASFRSRSESGDAVLSTIGADSSDGQESADSSIPCPAGLRFYTSGFGALIQNLTLLKSLSELKVGRYSPQHSLELLHQLTGNMRKRTLRCRALIQLRTGRYQPRYVVLSTTDIQREVDAYAASFGQRIRPQIDEYQSGVPIPAFAQEQDLLIQYLSVLVDYSALYYPSGKLQIKWLWAETSLKIETVLSARRIDGTVGVAESPELFEMQLETIGLAIGSTHKAVFTPTGGVGILELNPQSVSAELRDTIGGQSLILGGADYQVGTLVTALQALGLESNHLEDVAAVERFLTSSTVSAVFVWLDGKDPDQAEELLGLIARKSWVSAERVYLLRDVFDSTPLPKGDYRVLDQPFDLTELRALLAAKR